MYNVAKYEESDGKRDCKEAVVSTGYILGRKMAQASHRCQVDNISFSSSLLDALSPDVFLHSTSIHL
jgi:hypothetical protein